MVTEPRAVSGAAAIEIEIDGAVLRARAGRLSSGGWREVPGVTPHSHAWTGPCQRCVSEPAIGRGYFGMISARHDRSPAAPDPRPASPAPEREPARDGRRAAGEPEAGSKPVPARGCANWRS